MKKNIFSNKNLVLTAAVPALLVLALGCTKKVELNTDTQKASYAIGQQIGSNLKTQNIEFDADVLAASIKDASQGKESRMKSDEMMQALQKMQESMMKKHSEKSEKTKAEGKAFLEKNKSAPGVKTTASGLQYVMEKEGTGKSPTANDVVSVHYKGTLVNGEKFDSSYDRNQPAEFPVGGVIKGWTEALQLMKVGGKAKLFIPSELAYGEADRPGIPASSVLVFDVELLEVKSGSGGGASGAAAAHSGGGGAAKAPSKKR